MNYQIFEARTLDQLKKCFPVMRELRPHLDFQQYLAIYEQAHKSDGYQIVAIEKDQQVVAVMGYRLVSDMVRGKHVYIDDLISVEAARSQGLGAELLVYAEGVAKAHQCSVLRLCAVLENDRGIKFYEREGWTKRAYAFTKKLAP